MRRPARPWLGLLPLLLACSLAGCTEPPPDPLLAAGTDLLRATRLPADDAFADLNRFVAEQPRVAADAAATLVESGDESTRYAAVYVLGLVAERAEDVAALKMALDDDLTHLRAISAGSLIGLGEKDAVPVLIELLASTDEIPGSIPSLFVDRFSSETLTAYTGQDFGITEASTGGEREAAQQRWRDWWDGAGETLRWNASERRYEA